MYYGSSCVYTFPSHSKFHDTRLSQKSKVKTSDSKLTLTKIKGVGCNFRPRYYHDGLRHY